MGAFNVTFNSKNALFLFIVNSNKIEDKDTN